MLLSIMLLAAAEPMRPTEIDIVSGQSAADLQGCITRVLSTMGRITPIPIENGVTLDFQMAGFSLTGPGQARFSMSITDDGIARHINASYRHPLSAKSAANFTRDTAKRCFKDEYNATAAERRGGAKAID